MNATVPGIEAGVAVMRPAFCVLLLVCALGRADAELRVADLETPANPLVGTLDRWGDWLRGADTWQLSRRLVPDAPQGQFAVVTEPVAKDAAKPRGWCFTGLRVDGDEWAGMTDLRFWAKGKPGGKLPRVRDGMLSVRGLRRRVAHYRDKLVALRDVPDCGPMAAELDRLASACDDVRRQAQFSGDAPGRSAREPDGVWIRAKPVFDKYHERLRPTVRGNSWYRPGGRRIVPLAPHSV